jgi:hypothetical protein
VTAVLRPPLRLVSRLATSWRRAGALLGVPAVSTGVAAPATGGRPPVQVALVATSLKLATIGLSGGLLAVLAAVLAARFVALRLTRRTDVRGDGGRAGSSARDPAS